MPTIVCPSCGHIAEFDAMRRAADEFCRTCDFPLFWARADQPAFDQAAADAASRRRLPGSAGRQTMASKVCPECGELNPTEVRYCIRCGNDFTPPPPPPPAPDPEPTPVEIELPPPPPPPPLEVVEPDQSLWWIFGLVALGILAILLVA